MVQLTWWSLPPIVAACMALAAYVRAKPQDHIPGGHALRFLFLTLFIWSTAQALANILVSESAITLAMQFSYAGMALAPAAWFVFAMTYSQRVRKISRHAFNTITILPAITLVLALSNSSHGLIWQEWSVVLTNGFHIFQSEPGFWFYVHAMYSYSLILVATAILAFALTRHKQHYQTFLAAIFAPLVIVMSNLFSISPLNPYPWFNTTPLGVIFGLIIIDAGILRSGLLNQVPVARDWVVEKLKDPVLVLAHDGRIIDANISALEAWEELLPLQNSNIANLITTVPTEALLSSHNNSDVTINKRAYEVASTPLDRTNHKTDIAIVFRDVTERREALQELHNVKNKLERMAHTDALTGMYNRRFFMERLSEECERVKRHGSVFSVLMFDLDHFKRINDSYGHDQGDTVLVAIAHVVNDIKRASDVACRMGGEEFALLLPETNQEGAIYLAQRLRKGIETYPYRSNNRQPLTVTASIGVATVTNTITGPAEILKIADRALYRAKGGGRNMVCVDNEAA